MINTKTKIEDIVKIDSGMMDFFNREKIDFCCNGHMTIEEVAKEKNIDANNLAEKIQGAINSDNPNTEDITNLNDFKKLDIKEMIDSLVIDHHKKERDLLFEIDPLLNKILSVHFEHHGEVLMNLHSLFADLKKELEEHFVKEEEITFPLMLENKNPSLETIKKVEELESDHEKAGNIIKEMIDLTDWFNAPEDACNTYKYTFRLLEELSKDVFVHVFKENSIMFEKYRGNDE